VATAEMNEGEIPAEETAAEDEAAMEAAKAAEKAEKEAAKAAAKAEAEAARAARAEERAERKEQRKAARQVAADERSEQKAAKQAEREAAAAQKKAAQEAAAQEKPEKPEKRSKSKKAAAQEAAGEEEAASPSASVAQEASEGDQPSVLPAKLSKEKKPRKTKKVKPSSTKSVRRAIRPIRSRTQQTTARLIWAVFGMALVIVAIVGFWLVLSNQEDSTEVEVLVAAADLTEGNFVVYEDISTATIDIQDGSLAYLPSSNLDSLVGRVILRDVAQNTNLSLDMFGSSVIDEEFSQDSEIVFELPFPGEATLDPSGVNPGDRVVILIGRAESPERFAFEVVDVEAVTENTISLEGSIDYGYWWEQQLARYENQEGVVFEIDRVPDQTVPQLCWRERYRQIYQVEDLPRDEYVQLMDELGCPEYFQESGPGGTDTSDTETETEGTTPSESVADRLESDRYIVDRLVPDEINNPVATDGGDGGLEDLGDIGIDFSGIGFPEE